MRSSTGVTRTGTSGYWRRRVLLTLVAVLVSSLLGVVSGVVLVGGRGGATPSGPSSSSSPDPSPPTTTAAAAVRGYLEALARQDAAAALSHALTQPADTSLLTDEVLAASQSLAPITEVNVPEVPDSGPVQASYRIGSERVTETFSVTEVDGGGYRLDEVVSELDVSNLRHEDLPLRVAGVDVAGDRLTLFPGSYLVETGNPLVSYGDGVLLVPLPGRVLSSSGLVPTLTQEGRTTFISLLEDVLDECLAETSASPSGCPFEASIPTSHEVEGDRGRWVAEDDPVEDLEPRLDGADPTRATAYLSATLAFRYSYTSEYEEGEQDGEVSVLLGGSAVLELDAEPLQISFE